MWPGVRSLEGLGKFGKDDVVGMRNGKGEVVGIGALACSYEEWEKSSQNDKGGIAVYVLHYRNDKLWDLGPKNGVEVMMKAKEKEEEVKKEEKQTVEEGKKEEVKEK